MEAESELGSKIEETVMEILRKADLETSTEYSVRSMAAQRLGIDLSDLHHRRLVRRVLESFLLSSDSLEGKVQEETKEFVQEQQQPENTAPNVVPIDAHSHEYGGRVICKLSDKTSVAIQDFRGTTLVSIRDYYQKNGKQFPSARGISLTAKQWSAFRNGIPAIEKAILKMDSRIRSENVRKPIVAGTSNSMTPLASQGLHPAGREQVEADASNTMTAFTPQGHITIERKQFEADISNAWTACSPQGDVQHNSMAAFSPQGLIPIENTRLDGKNYHCWMNQMALLLKQMKIAYVLTEPCPSIFLCPKGSSEEITKAKAAARKWIEDDFFCRRNILNSLSDDLFHQYSKKIHSAKELWEELKSEYDEDFRTMRSQVNKYIQFQMVDGITILEQVQELHRIANSIIESGVWIDENFHVSVIISKLPPSWKECRVKLLQMEFLPLNMLIYHLKVEEECRSRCKKEYPFKDAHVIGSRLESKLGPRKRETKRLCYTCGGEGHISKHCPHRKFDIQEQSNEKDNDVAAAITEVNMAEETGE